LFAIHDVFPKVASLIFPIYLTGTEALGLWRHLELVFVSFSVSSRMEADADLLLLQVAANFNGHISFSGRAFLPLLLWPAMIPQAAGCLRRQIGRALLRPWRLEIDIRRYGRLQLLRLVMRGRIEVCSSRCLISAVGRFSNLIRRWPEG
jgi:hypothetical protein